MRQLRVTLFLSVLFTFSLSLHAQLRLPAVIASGMVLQQKDSVMLWGWSSPGAKVYIHTGWNDVTDSTTATNGAEWSKKVFTPEAGGPYTIVIRSYDSIVLNDVMIGEVWVCSGQSNMEWNYYAGEKDVREDIHLPPNKNIRFFHIPKTTATYPQDDVKAQWKVCDSNTLKSFSAIGYFFGKKISDSISVPVGLINASWGGTPAEVWTPAEIIEKDKELAETTANLNKTSTGWPWMPGVAYNGMIAPITRFNIAGAIWYQGEANVPNHATYQKLLTTMIGSWRTAWAKELPFYYVQIAPFNYSDSNINGALLQEAQAKVMSHPKTGMVVVTDLVDSVTDIHPSHKREVGNRLASWALANTYGRKNVIFRSPEFEKAVVAGNKVELTFKEVPTSLKSAEKQVKGFMISDDGNRWLPAEARINKNTITVWNKKIKKPVEVRYAFTNTLIGNVSSQEGLPLTPFRSGKL